MKIALATTSSPGYKELADITEPSKVSYCERWGYSWQPFKPLQNPARLQRGEVTEQSEPDIHYDAGGYVRYEHVMRLMDQGFDLILQIGADALVMNQTIRLEDFLDQSDATGFVPGVFVSSDCNFINDENIIWARRPHSDGVDVVRQLCWEMTRQPGGAHHEHQTHPCGWNHPYGCQHALRDYLFLHPEYRKVANFLPQRVLDANLNDRYGFPGYVQGQYQSGDFILHLPGMDWQQRCNLAREYAGKIVT